jgi:glycine hydroxymethyltransferase
MLEHGFDLVSGGTDNHLMLVDLRSKALTGKVAEEALGEADITVNKNKVPFDPESPMVTSGFRIGTPAVTSRGMKEAEMAEISQLIADALAFPEDPASLSRVRDGVHALTAKFPLYAHLVEEAKSLLAKAGSGS